MLHLEMNYQYLIKAKKLINDHLPNMTINDELKDTKKTPLLDHIIDLTMY